MNKTLTSHGGDIYTEGLLKGKELIDYSSNINLLGVPNSFYEGIKEATNLINHYPDIQYRTTILYLSISNVISSFETKYSSCITS